MSVRAPEGARLLAGVGRPPTLAEHERLFGRLSMPRDLPSLAEAANLRGRGGGGFPAGRKLAAVAGQGGEPIVVANGAEGEPASKKDRSLLRVAPHLVLDGAVAAASAVGARQVVVAVSRDIPELTAAVAERRTRISVERVPDSFVAGEETAVLRALAGKPAKPTTKPPFPFQRGLDGRPTLVNNVETLAHLALIARFGPGWFAGGTVLVTLGGAFNRPGVHEVPVGLRLAELVDACGGLSAKVDAFLVGGYFGHWVPAEAAGSLALTADVLGAGAVIALPASTCAAAECAAVARYLANESAGQCGPCVNGLPALADALDVDRRGDRRRDALRYAALVAGRGACRHPDGAARFVESALEVFADEFARHAGHKRCGRRNEHVLPVPS